MPIIKILDKEVYNKIAAGEVVERPASVVKELLENGIDAGADMISIDIENGGIGRITVTDNGCGMEPEDLKTAFLPHATSKLHSADDLFDLNTLGFRGEALPSIAAVSKVTVFSRFKNNEIGEKYSINCGISEYFQEISCPTGTNITIKDLFCNVPARAKFLKTARGEEAEVTALVSKMILSNPMVAIKYGSGGRTVFHSAGQGLKSALFTVYGAEAANAVLPVASEYKGIRVSGFVGKPDFSKPNRTYGTLIVNGRSVVNYAAAKAIADCYEGRLMKHQFPFYVLNVDLDRAAVDVNVHPNKLEVRFSDFGTVRGAITKAVSDALCADRGIVGIRESEPARVFNVDSILKMRDFKNTTETNNKIYEYYSDNARTGILSENTGLLNKILRAEAPLLRTEAPKTEKEREIFPPTGDAMPGKIAGTVFDTYIFIESGDTLFLIDQHAAHERILYDRLIAEAEQKTVAVQRLLVPYTFRCGAAEGAFIEENTEVLAALGFDTARFSADTYRIDSVPASLSDMDLRIFVDTLLADLHSVKLKSVEVLRDRIMKEACRSAVKGGDKLGNDEIRRLLQMIGEQDAELRCPHGRPIVVKLSKCEIEKWFKRRI
ncbi:DNA mismatch repair protein MutL [Clostridia bacterium]|nr:DNA mismatch repair protein MutL [Clostridia bacterium]